MFEVQCVVRLAKTWWRTRPCVLILHELPVCGDWRSVKHCLLFFYVKVVPWGPYGIPVKGSA